MSHLRTSGGSALGVFPVSFVFVVFPTLTLAHCSSDSSGSPGNTSDASTNEVQAIVADAVIRGSCIPALRPNRLLDEHYRTHRSADYPGEELRTGAAACIAASRNGCSAITDCLGLSVGALSPPATCKTQCTGNSIETCDRNVRYRYDCARFGLVCDPVSVGCVPPPVTVCDSAKLPSVCDQGTPVECVEKHRTKGLRCADFGLACVDGTGGQRAFCKGSGAACSGLPPLVTAIDYDGIGCDGSRLRACVGGGEAVVDCASVAPGFTCQTVTAGAARDSFCGQAAECDPVKAGDATCDGNTLVLCNAGKIERVPCSSLGFTGCDAKNGVCSPNPR